MIVKGVTDEDFVNYKVPNMFISTSKCSFKCDKECGISCCQNSSLVKQESIDIEDELIIKRYLNNPITHAVVFGGLEPFDQFDELMSFIYELRCKFHCLDPVIIYTGYIENEIKNECDRLRRYKNIIIKFGRFIPNQEKHFDTVLGVHLASPNQYAVKVS